MEWMAGVLSLGFFTAIAWITWRLKEPPSLAFAALMFFGCVPILLLLKSEIAAYAVETPQGKFSVKIAQLENKVETVQARADTSDSSSSSASTPSSVKPGTKIRITDIGTGDGFYSQRDSLIGEVGTVQNLNEWDDGWSYGKVVGTSRGELVFFRFHYELAQ